VRYAARRDEVVPRSWTQVQCEAPPVAAGSARRRPRIRPRNIAAAEVLDLAAEMRSRVLSVYGKELTPRACSVGSAALINAARRVLSPLDI
jgi:hypothetical protein